MGKPPINEHDEGLPSYLGRLTQVPLLTAQQEEELTLRARNGDKEARQKLIEANMRLVINIARSYRNKSVALEDLIQDGAIGLMQAAERFDPERGFRFSTYATHWIKQAIGRAIDNRSKTIRVPAHVSQAMRKIEKARTAFLTEHHAEPTLEQLGQLCGIAPDKIQQIVLACQELISLDLKVGESGATTLGGLLRDTACDDAEARILSEEAKAELRQIFAELSERERTVMEMRFQMDEHNSQALTEEVARGLHITRERVRQIEVQAIKKLRYIAQQRKLSDLLPHL